MSGKRRAARGDGPLDLLDAGKRNECPQHDTTGDRAVTIQSTYRWATSTRRRSLELELQRAWVSRVGRRAA